MVTNSINEKPWIITNFLENQSIIITIKYLILSNTTENVKFKKIILSLSKYRQVFEEVSAEVGLLNNYCVGSKKCRLLSFKELLLTRITQPPEVSVKTFFYLCVFCLFLSVCFHAVRDILLEPT